MICRCSKNISYANVKCVYLNIEECDCLLESVWKHVEDTWVVLAINTGEGDEDILGAINRLVDVHDCVLQLV